jgi:hypothetical protein
LIGERARVTVGLGVNIELNAWPLPPVFAWLAAGRFDRR